MSNVYTGIAELEWYFNNSHAQMGICSNFTAIRNALMNGGVSRTSGPDSQNDSRLDAAIKYRRVNDKLLRLPSNFRDYIYAAYGSRDYGPELFSVFGRATGVAVYSESANKEFEIDAAKKHDDHTFYAWLRGCIARHEDMRVEKIRREATRLLDAAHRHYAAMGDDPAGRDD